MPEACTPLLETYIECEPFVTLVDEDCTANVDGGCSCAADYLYADILTLLEVRCDIHSDDQRYCECWAGGRMLGMCPQGSGEATCSPAGSCCSMLFHLPP